MLPLAATTSLDVASPIRPLGHRTSLTADGRGPHLRVPGGMSMMATTSQHRMRDKREQRQDMSGQLKHVNQA